MNNWSLENKTALITGGSKGIGLAIVEELLSLGCEVFFAARTQNDVLKIINKHKEKNLHGIIADVSTEEGREKIYHIICIDCYIFCGEDCIKPLHDLLL